MTVGFGPLLDPDVAAAAGRGYGSSRTTCVETSADRFHMDRTDSRDEIPLRLRKKTVRRVTARLRS